MADGTPGIILTKNLTEKAAAIVQESPSVLALTYGNDGIHEGTKLTSGTCEAFYEGRSLWNLSAFLDEVLR